MSDEQLIPNAVERLDDVVEALQASRTADAIDLLWKRSYAIMEKSDAALKEYQKANEEYRQVKDFIMKMEIDSHFAYRVRMACRGGAEVKASESEAEIGFFTMLRRNCDDA